MAEKHNVAMFIQNDQGERVQVGWASPRDESGVRTFEYSEGFEGTRPKDVSFEDDELSQQVAEEQHEARQGDGSDGDEFEIEVIPEDDGVVPLPEVPLTPIPWLTDNADVEDDSNDFVENNGEEEPTVVEPVAPVTDAPDEEFAADPIEEAPDAELADDPTDNSVDQDELVELTNGGEIVDVNFDDDENDN